MRHAITVGSLADLLRLLEPTDVLIPNTVGNLRIDRAGEYIGYIDLLEDCQEVEFLAGEEPK